MNPRQAIEDFNHPDTAPDDRLAIIDGLEQWRSMGGFHPCATLCPDAIESIRAIDARASLLAQLWNADATPEGGY